MATNAKLPPPPPTNGVITGPTKGAVGGNRKKQKRRAKQAAKVADQPPPHGYSGPPHTHDASNEIDYDEDPLGYDDEADDYDSYEAEPEHYHDQYIPAHAGTNGYSEPSPAGAKKKKGKKGRAVSQPHGGYHDQIPRDPNLLGTAMPPLPTPPPPPPAMSSAALRSVQRSVSGQPNIWNTSTQQERQNIKDFWLSLSEDERKSLLKIEKEAVLRKMKQQQKHSCSCTVCGRKRTAIEEELEVLYEGYYEELEQYAHHDHPPGLPSTEGMLPPPLQHRKAPPPLPANPQHRNSRIHEVLDDATSDEEEDEEEYSDEDEYSDDEPDMMPPQSAVADFFNFGQGLTVKGILTPWLEKLHGLSKGDTDGILTVADDLLKNDGRKFIEMMEQLAERRMQRENEAEYAATRPQHPPGAYDPTYNHEDPLAAGDEFDDEEGSYDSQEEYDDEVEEEDEMVRAESGYQDSMLYEANDTQGGLTEQQRMEEGRRMFQIFAARMFEQRVLTAYREKVAAERQQKLLEELEDETKLEAQREAKKQRDAEKKKNKKKQQQQAKAEEKAKRDAEKAAEEAQLREAEEKKLEEQRRKKEEQRKKKEEEKRKQDEERAKKEADKLRRQAEEQQRREESERKARELKAQEKKAKDEARKKEREEREAREKEVRDRKSQEDREKREREAKVKADTEVKPREKSTQQAALPPQPLQHPQITKRPSQAGMVAVPGLYPKQTPSGISSPLVSVATPVLPKAPTTVKPRQPSQQGSHASSPKTSQVSSEPSKSTSPSSASAQQHSNAPTKTIMQKPTSHQGPPQQHHPGLPATSPVPGQQIQPPPGMNHPQHAQGFGGMPPMGFPGFQGPQGPMMAGGLNRGSMPMYPHQGLPVGMQNRMPFGPGMNGMNGMPPPGMMPQQGRGMPFPFDAPGAGVPPGFPHQLPHLPPQTSPIGQPPGPPGFSAPREGMPTHSRQASASEKDRFEGHGATQPIQRPAPIQRPSSVKPTSQERKGSNTDVDDLSRHLGSSALLDDSDEPMPSMTGDSRRRSDIPAGVGRNGPMSNMGSFGSPAGGFGGPNSTWNTPAIGFGAPSQPNWGNLPAPGMGGWSNNNAAFASNGAFGTLGGAPMHRPAGAGPNRPLTIRLAVCQACKQLSNAARGEGDGFHDVGALLRQIEMNRPMLDSPPTLREIEEICETEGDSQNGGGELRAKKDIGSQDSFAVKWEADATTPEGARGPAGLGEIGSPMPSKTTPAAFGAPGMGRGGFQSLGAVGSPNF